jgi:SAM-dependent methyltransferase
MINSLVRKIHYILLYLVTLIAGFVFKKRQKFCPICESHFNAFLPFGEKLRANALCPKCGSLERHRISYTFLKNNTNVFEDKIRLLHFAPEKVLAEKFLSQKNIEYVGVDINSELPYVTEKIDIQKMRYADETFDFIFCSHVLEHVIHDKKALKELFRILKLNGKAVIIVPINHSSYETREDPIYNTPELRLKHYDHPEHLRYYGQDFRIKLENAGFKIISDNFSRDVDVKAHDLAADGFFYCKKENK